MKIGVLGTGMVGEAIGSFGVRVTSLKGII